MILAKLYWRIKRDGKWTWVAATPENTSHDLDLERTIYDGPELCIDGKYIEFDDEVVEKPEVISHLWDVNPGEEE
jgi:hypothetical protein